MPNIGPGPPKKLDEKTLFFQKIGKKIILYSTYKNK